MKEMQIFINDEFGDIRTAEINGKPYFMASDIAKSLGYNNPNKAVNDHCRAITKWSIPIGGKKQEVNFIGEGDIYRLVVRSKMPSAEKFEMWVFDEVLPEIRATGTYCAPEKTYDTKSTSLGEVASYTKEMDRRMEKQGTSPWKICEAFRMVSEQFGIKLPTDFVKIPEYEQMELALNTKKEQTQ